MTPAADHAVLLIFGEATFAQPHLEVVKGTARRDLDDDVDVLGGADRRCARIRAAGQLPVGDDTFSTGRPTSSRPPTAVAAAGSSGGAVTPSVRFRWSRPRGAHAWARCVSDAAVSRFPTSTPASRPAAGSCTVSTSTDAAAGRGSSRCGSSSTTASRRPSTAGRHGASCSVALRRATRHVASAEVTYRLGGSRPRTATIGRTLVMC